jgi:EpsI family protein
MSALASPAASRFPEDRRAWILLAAMLLSCLLAFALTPRHKLADLREKIDLNASVPQKFGDWVVDATMVPVNPSPVQQATLEQTYDQMVNRTYVNPQGQRVMLSMAYGSAQTNELRAHRQEVCYGAQGFQISQLGPVLLPLAGQQIKATRMVATAGRRIEPVTYWFTMGDQVVLSYTDRQVTQLRYALSGVIPDGYLMRLSSIGDNPETEYALQMSFATDLFAALPAQLKRKLVGGL